MLLHLQKTFVSSLPPSLPPSLLTDRRPRGIRHGLKELARELGACALGLLADLVLHVLFCGEEEGVCVYGGEEGVCVLGGWLCEKELGGGEARAGP